MAYNGFPATYPQMYPQYQQPFQQPPTFQQPQNSQGFIRVQSENEARMYPVQAGTSVVFIDERLPYCYTKTVEMSQLDRPKFEKYRLVKEEEKPPQEKEETEVKMQNYILREEFDKVIDELNKKISDMQQTYCHNHEQAE